MPPIRDLLMDADGDLAASGGDLALVGGETAAENIAAVKQSITIRVRLFLREYFLDEAEGLDWIDTLLAKGTDPVVIRELIRAQIAGTPDVTAVVSGGLVVDPATREAVVAYAVWTRYSTTPVSGEIALP